jgi:excisionase family DNA binding protein
VPADVPEYLHVRQPGLREARTTAPIQTWLTRLEVADRASSCMTTPQRTRTNPTPTLDVVPPVLLTPEQAARALGLGRTTVYALIRDGELRSVRLGRSRRIPYAHLIEFVERLNAIPVPRSSA